MKKISMLELMMMMGEGNQPKKIKYKGIIFKLTEDKTDYIENNNHELSTYYFFENGLVNDDKTIEILDDLLEEKEKEYLSKVIEPFRNQVRFIVKCSWCCKEFIRIGYYQAEKFEHLDFPLFSPNTMYKGMRVNQEYSLEELGL